MSPELFNTLITLTAVAFALVGLFLIIKGITSILRFRPRGSIRRTLGGVVVLFGAGLSAILVIGLQGYQVLTREDVAASLFIKPLGEQRFQTKVRFTDGRELVYQLNGDEVYVDARILKWHPIVHMFGIHTVYELNRIAGRYSAIEQEQSAPRTVYALSEEKPLDVFSLRRRYEFLRPLVDAQYGSATFIPVSGPAEFEIRVSTTGLLMRRVDRAH